MFGEVLANSLARGELRNGRIRARPVRRKWLCGENIRRKQCRHTYAGRLSVNRSVRQSFLMSRLSLFARRKAFVSRSETRQFWLTHPAALLNRTTTLSLV